MDYRIRLFFLRPGVDVEFVAHADEPDPGLPDGRGLLDLPRPVHERACLVAAALEPAPERLTEEDPGEFNWPMDGMKIVVLSNEVAISLAHWHRGDRAERLIGSMLKVVQECRRAGMTAYDHQLGRSIGADADAEAMMRVYQRGVDAVKGVATGARDSAHKWWRFW